MSNLRVFIYDGKPAVFHKKGFQHLLTQKSIKEKIAKSKLEVQIANEIGVSPDTVHKWNYSGGGPMDVDAVKRLAAALDISDQIFSRRPQSDLGQIFLHALLNYTKYFY